MKYISALYFKPITENEKLERLEKEINTLCSLFLNCEIYTPHIVLKVDCEQQAKLWCEKQLIKCNK